MEIFPQDQYSFDVKYFNDLNEDYSSNTGVSKIIFWQICYWLWLSLSDGCDKWLNKLLWMIDIWRHTVALVANGTGMAQPSLPGTSLNTPGGILSCATTNHDVRGERIRNSRVRYKDNWYFKINLGVRNWISPADTTPLLTQRWSCLQVKPGLSNNTWVFFTDALRCPLQCSIDLSLAVWGRTPNISVNRAP